MYPPYDLKVQTPQPTDDGIGGVSSSWVDGATLSGYIDLVTGTDLPNGTTDNAFIENSTHIAICPEADKSQVTDNDRLVGPDGKVYDVTYVDDPVGIGHHLEIYLRYPGGDA